MATASYFLSDEEMAEMAYREVRAHSLVLFTSSEMAEQMIAYIQINHYHIVSSGIKLACRERVGATNGLVVHHPRGIDD